MQKYVVVSMLFDELLETENKAEFDRYLEQAAAYGFELNGTDGPLCVIMARKDAIIKAMNS